jgi:hypothetical protein
MIKRERWIVYPLLFLVISISLKDKLNSQQKSLQLKNLKVEQLEVGRVQGGNANFRKIEGTLIQGRRLNILDQKGIPKVVLHNAPALKENEPDFEKAQGAITLLSGENQEMLVLGGGGGGGFIAARSLTQPKDFVAFGYQAGRVGIFWLDQNGKPQGFLKPEQHRIPNEKNLPAEEKEPGKENDLQESTQNTTPNP